MPLIAAAAGFLASAGCGLIDNERASASADGRGHRAATEPPATMARSVCPEYRENNPGRAYHWDRLAYRTPLEAEIEHCSRVLTGPLGRWVVEERSDEGGSYSIAAYVPADAHSVAFDWAGFEPILWLSCWLAGPDADGEPPGDGADAGRNAESTAKNGSLVASLWYFGPPQQVPYGEPTPVRYEFDGESGFRTQLWLGHPGQAEVALLSPPDSHQLARDIRRAADEHDNEDTGPLLLMETWEGESLSGRNASQGSIEFDLVGLERAAFPVFDACGI